MAKLKHTFVRGRMNKDIDERMLPNGEYRDALNIQVATSEGSNVGAIENILGNTKKNIKTGTTEWASGFGLTNPVCIGHIRDPRLERIYWFITSDTIDAILEYDQSLDIVSPVLVDANGVLNFSATNLITGVNIIENLLAWTDDLNEPKILEIEKFKAGSAQPGTTLSTHTSVYGRSFIESDITVIKLKPITAPTYVASETIRGGFGTGFSPVEVSYNFTESTQNFGQVPLETGASVTFTTSQVANWQVGDTILLTTERVTTETSFDEYRVRILITQINFSNVTGSIVSLSADIDDAEYTWDAVLEEDDPMFNLLFPRFAYRWKYAENEYSPYSPFTQAVFVPSTYKFTGKDGYNTGMENNLRKLTLSGFDTPPANVAKLEILYKDSSENNIYKVDEVDPTTTQYEITSELIYGVIDSNQLIRPYDDVPRKAKAQEVVGNRLVYGNYLHNFDVPGNTQLGLEVQSRNISEVNEPERSLKSMRTYQIGVVYMDAYGRETPVFTNDTATIHVPKKNAPTVNNIEITALQSAPSWATHFKYHIKDISNEYYNFSIDRYYYEDDDNIWLSVPSNERNKVMENDHIILKKQHGTDVPVTEKAKYKILDISNEAPDAVAKKKKFVSTAAVSLQTSTTFLDHIEINSGRSKFNFHGPRNFSTDGDSTFFEAWNNASDLYIKFSVGANETKFYKVISGGPVGNETINNVAYTVYRVEIDEKLEETFLDANVIDFFATLYEEKRIIKEEYEGRFFIKISRDSMLDDNVIFSSTSNPDNYYIATTQIPLDHSQGGITPYGEILYAPGAVISSPELAFGWYEHNQATQYAFLGPPVLGSAKIGFAAVYTGTYGNAADFVSKIAPGAVVRFQETAADPSISLAFASKLYIIKSVNFSVHSPRGTENPAQTLHTWEIELTEPVTESFGGTFQGYAYMSIMERSRILGIDFDGDSEIDFTENPAVFETEPKDNIDLELYYEATNAIDVANLRTPITLGYFNCFTFGNGVESDRVRDDFNAKRITKGVKVSSIINEESKEERRGSGLIYSGLFNSTSGVNELNQFIAGLKITKDLDPSYGTIQKLHTRDTNLIALAEDKVYRIYADKDALYNADGNANLLSTNRVLGEASTFAGEFGISKNPESFATYGFRAYFTDKARGAVLRLSNDGLTEISEKGMADFFVDAFASNATPVIGSFDESTSSYNIKLNDESLSFKERVDGWPTRLSFEPEAAVSLNNEYYTFKNGEIWEHSNQTRNRFYGVQYPSSVTTIFNDSPSSIKNFKTLSYEGTPHWAADVSTDKQNGSITNWRNNEGIYYNFIKGENLSLAVVNGQLNSKDFSVQGIGEITAITPGIPYNIEVGGDINTSLSVNDTLYIKRGTGVLAAGPVLDTVINRVTFTDSGVAPQVGEYAFFLKSNAINTSGLLGYYANITFTNSSTDFAELFAVNSEVFISSE